MAKGFGVNVTLPYFRLLLSDDEFKLRSLPTDILEGVVQRARGLAKDQIEQVDQRFAVVAHRLAWRHHHTLKVTWATPRGNTHPPWRARLSVGTTHMQSLATDTPAAARYIVARSAIHHIDFNIGDDEDGCFITDVDFTVIGQAVLAALQASQRVALHSLILHQTPEQLFGGSDQLAALIHRHSATLEEAGVFFGDGQPTAAVSDALSACPGLRTLTAFIDSESPTGNWPQPLGQLIQRLQLGGLTMSGEGCLEEASSVAAVLPSSPKLTELRLFGLATKFDVEIDWSALANIRLFQAATHCFGLLSGDSQAEANRVFATVLPSLEVLIFESHEVSPYVYWTLLKKLVTAFLNRAGDHSLAVELPVFKYDGQAWHRPLTEWRAVFPELSVEDFGAATPGQAVKGAAAAAATRPKLPKEFQHAVASQVVILGRPNESRRITIALWEKFPFTW